MLTILKKWLFEDAAHAAVEAALIFPVMLTLFFGTVDVGFGLIVNKKTISASQVAVDLLTREDMVSNDELEDTIAAARMAMEPYDLDTFGIDIISVRFTGVDATPEIVWRETRDMTPLATVLDDVAGLGTDGEGVLVVAITYSYRPPFSQAAFDTIDMQEVSFARGRSVPVIARG